MRTAVDTNVLFDILLPDPVHEKHSLELLHRASVEGTLCICETAAAELGSLFPNVQSFQLFLNKSGISLTPMRLITLYEAGNRWRRYLKKRTGPRERVIADFMIAAHAMHEADRLLTRDLGFYRGYFRDLNLLS